MLTDLRREELLVGVRVPKVREGAGSAYVRLARVEGSFAIVNAAALVNGGRPVIAIGGATGSPVLVEPDVDVAGGVSEGPWMRSATRRTKRARTRTATSTPPPSIGELASVYARRAVQAALAARPS